MFTSILNTQSSTLAVSSAVIAVLAAIILGLIISFTYMKSGRYSKDFAITLVLLPVLVQIVIMLVNGNLGAGVAVAGAFSLVRFRSVAGSSREICAIFFAMAIGLATGMGYLGFATVFTVIVCILFLILSRSKFGKYKSADKQLKITIPENLDYTEIFDDIFSKYTKGAQLEKVKTTNLGSMYELSYDITLTDVLKEKEFIDNIRCRNGNLTIICARQAANKDEL